jgi:nucleoside-diphosphate-sugar epimerase
MKVLFIGGTGLISSACSKMAVEKGVELYLINRGKTNRHVPPQAIRLNCDVHNLSAKKSTVQDLSFDVVVNWIAYSPDQIKNDIELFRGKTGQYIFISSASAYKKPVTSLPITESTPLFNPFWQYSRDKIACEELLLQEYRSSGFPATIVRPSHTFDETRFPFRGGYSILERMRLNRPIIIHGDGTSIWTMTHHLDFAKGFVGLLGNPQTIGEAFHITSDEVLTWNQIFDFTAQAAGATPNYVHISSEFIARYNSDWGASLLGDKSHCAWFDNSKIKRFVPAFQATIPFWQGIKDVVKWHDENPQRHSTDIDFLNSYEKILKGYQKK